ncbi:beta-lactamase family protein [Alteromonas sp. 5E99-2]|nr:beta-lactamase family protein [Alteromonas sp. 5E99-2]
MKYSVLTLLASFLLLIANWNLAYASGKDTSPISESINQQLAKNSERYGVVGQSVLILKNHQHFYQGHHGFANLELGVSVNEKHIFPSYSITKLFTSVLMMQQVEQGNVVLSNSIREYLPYLPKKWQPVTVEHLLNHTSGIPRYFDKAINQGSFLPTKKAVFLSLIDDPEHFKLGTMNSYNNTNYLLLSAILEAKTGKSYKELVADVIITPLELENTGHTSAKDIIKNHVSSY